MATIMGMLMLLVQASASSLVFAVDVDDDYDYDYIDDEEFAENENFDDDDYLEADDVEEYLEDESQYEASEEEISEFEKQAQAKIDELQGKYNKLETQRKEAQKKLTENKNKREQEEQKQRTIAFEIKSVAEQISLLERKQQLLEKEIGKKEIELKERQEHRKEEYELLKARIRSDHMSGKPQAFSSLGLLFGRGNFFDALTHVDFRGRIMAKDREIIDRIKAQEAQLEKDKMALEGNKAELVRTRTQISEKKKQLDNDYNAVSKQIYDIKLLEHMWLARREEYVKQEAEYQSEISRILSQLKSMSDKYVGGELAWPVPGYYDVYSPFGNRNWGNGFTDFHGGIDIAGSNIYGKNVVAANAGKVAYVSYSNSKSYGSYGNYVIIDHGGGIMTLYGHLSTITVTQDQMVAKGQKTGEVGATGFVTGPHLHFEVRENGTRVNPMPYLGN